MSRQFTTTGGVQKSGTRQTPRLSKTRFISGCQCPLKLWFDINQPSLAGEADEARLALFAAGHTVGDLAQERWPGGVLVDAGPRERARAIAHTQSLLDNPSVPAIYEACIVHRNVLTRADILVRTRSGAWDLVEVKRSTRVKPPFDTDVALQYWILRGAGLPVRRAGLLVLNRDYVYPGGEYDLQKLFRFEDLTEQCEQRLEEIGEKVTELHTMLAAPEPPDITVGEHCYTPYECDHLPHCSRDLVVPEHPITLLPNLKGWRLQGLVDQGVDEVEDIPDDYELTATQERVRDCITSGRPWISPGLREALEDVEWPLHFLDFEAVSLDLPRFAGMRPFDQLPFQFSCHSQSQPGGELVHHEFLAEDGSDPRRPLAQALLDAVGDQGSIVVYSAYEKRTIRTLADWLPDLAERLLPLCDRLVDLLQIIRSHYCHPGFKGSYSIKQVLPVLVPEMSYSGMQIADGQAAGWGWLQMLEAETQQERDQLRTALLAYCGQDSLAMARLLDRLRDIAEGDTTP